VDSDVSIQRIRCSNSAQFGSILKEESCAPWSAAYKESIKASSRVELNSVESHVSVGVRESIIKGANDQGDD
jgi:hypothetical protein